MAKVGLRHSALLHAPAFGGVSRRIRFTVRALLRQLADQGKLRRELQLCIISTADP